jgi:hypothetical protein
MDAPGFVPVYANMERVLADQKLANPEAHRRVVAGDIPGIRVPAAEAFLLPVRHTVDLRDELAVLDLDDHLKPDPDLPSARSA